MRPSKFLAIAGTSFLAVFGLVASLQAQTNRSKPSPAAPKSVFDEKLRTGKDPFFPNSTRRAERIVAANPQQPPNPVVQLSLKAILGSANNRHALINNKTFAEGEEGFVKVPNGQVKIHCLEIKESSAVVTVEGDPERKELKLREGL